KYRMKAFQLKPVLKSKGVFDFKTHDDEKRPFGKFMEGNVGLDEFLDSFQSSRKTYHIRRAQVEKMQEATRARKQPSPPSSSSPAEPQAGQTHILGPGNPLPGHGQPVGLRVIGQLPGGWRANGRPVRVQQLYRPNPQQPEPPYR
uniref:VPS37 C-terminal domain-containing protein n=1 Tax=Oryzias sinensis TaxID=183150 RepID=A0A8C7WPK6_9TELE